MKKLIALVLSLLLLASLPVFAETEATEAEPEFFTAEGIVTEIADAYFILDTQDMGEIQVNFDAETYFTDYVPFACGQYAFVMYDGKMTRSIPAQIYAMNVTVSRVVGKVIGLNDEHGFIVIYNELQGEVIVYLNETDSALNYEKDEYVMVYNNGAMTLSLPPQISGSLIVRLYNVYGTITEVTEEYIMVNDGESDYQVVFAPDTTVTIPSTEMKVGDEINVIYNGMMTRSIPAQITAIDITVYSDAIE